MVTALYVDCGVLSRSFIQVVYINVCGTLMYTVNGIEVLCLFKQFACVKAALFLFHCNNIFCHFVY